jgi:hypothetical protein
MDYERIQKPQVHFYILYHFFQHPFWLYFKFLTFHSYYQCSVLFGNSYINVKVVYFSRVCCKV